MKSRKSIRIAIRVLIALLLLVFLVLVVGDFAINRYLNADGNRDLSMYLPINGALTYDRVSLHPFRDFPDLTIRMSGIELTDSLADEHGHPPMELDELNVRVSVTDWSEKEIAIESVDLNGLTLNVFDRQDGYSNLANLIRKNIKKKVDESNKPGVSVLYNNASVNISDVNLNKIDEQIEQRAHANIGEIHIDNELIDSDYHLNLTLNEIRVSELPVESKNETPIEIHSALAKVELEKTFSNLTIGEFVLKQGHVHLLTDSLGESNYSRIFGTYKKPKKEKKINEGGMRIAVDRANVLMDDIDFALVEHPKNKHLEARVVKLATEIQANADTSALIDLELNVDQLAFNTRKGAYLSNSLVAGQIQTRLLKNHIEILSPALAINEEPYEIQARVYSDNKTPTTLTIEKNDIITTAVRPLLTKGIRKSIKDYDISGPFRAKASVWFTPGKKDPRVEIDLKVQNKTVRAKGQTIKRADVSATFVNRLHDDSRQFRENRKNVRFMIHSLSGELNEFKVESKNAMITSTPDGGDRLIGKAQITGRAASASRFLNHDKFNFQDGNFILTTDINGSLNNLDDLIAGTDLNLSMDDLQVHYPEGNAQFPFRILELSKKGEKTVFHIEGYTENHQRPFHIRGEVDRVESFLFPGKGDRLQTEANIRASSVSWEGIIALFGKDGIFSSVKKVDEKQAKRSMKQTLTGIEKSFHPLVSITIDTVFYGKDIQLFDFNTGLKFDDERTLVLEKTTFQIDKSTVSLDGEVDINRLDFTQFDFDIELNHLDFDALMPKFDYFDVHLIKQIHDQPDNLSMKVKLSGELDDNAGLRPESINADITYESFAEDKFSGRITLKANPATKKVDVVFGHSGHPRNFNHLLETDAYRFDRGWYTISFNFDDNFETVAQMVEKSKFNLTIDDAEVYITELGVTVPLTRIEVASIRNKAYYHLLLRSDSLDQQVAFNGIVNNIRHFAFKDTDDSYEVELEISSPRIIWKHLKQLIAYQQQDQDQDEAQSGKALKESLTKVLHDFNPNVKLKIDALEYSDRISFNDIFAHAYLDGNVLKIDSANVAYGESHVQASVEANMGFEDVLPFNLTLNLNNIDVGQTLEHFDYFNVDELRDAKQLDGNIWFDLDMQAEMDIANQGFNAEKTNAEIKFKLHDVVIEDLQTIDTISIGMGFDRRLDVLRFAPIESRILVKGKRIEVRETEIQSNAVHAFIEGALDKDSPESLWVSIPIKNIKRPDLNADPEKTGYESAGRKVYLQLISSHDEDDGKMKVHLRKKKFFQERFKAKQFRAYKRINRRERRKLRQQQRQVNKLNASEMAE